ncbi:MAG: glycosyltransferase family 4 protein [Nanobdellota archaeon]
MKVLMFGWEFPPYNSGGLGTACKGLTKGLKNNDVKVKFVLPKAPKGANSENAEILSANDICEETDEIETKRIKTLLMPYISYADYDTRKDQYTEMKHKYDDNEDEEEVYGKDLYEEVHRYAAKGGIIAKHTDFDVIHSHDWMTYKAGMEAKKKSGKPFVAHVHATEFDRTAGNPNQAIYNIEREGMHSADNVITVSNFTKDTIVNHYGVPPQKVNVVHNAVEFTNYKEKKISKEDKMILFLGRLTIQKGPEHFLHAARKAAEYDPDIKFMVAGGGDMENRMVELAAELGISNRVLFSGFLRGDDIDRAYQMAKAYVMPSISEPFGITPLESMRNGTPAIVSKQSGVSEVIKHSLKVDFWDIDRMADMMHAVANYKGLHKELSGNCTREAHTFSWDVPAEKCINVYRDTMNMTG